ncbi:Uncharacterised protein [Mycobacteroides abscessus subsp. abscessus]|nr:Uncharacterised protein [Mycobacteroides abscessus subsp. abscessus]
MSAESTRIAATPGRSSRTTRSTAHPTARATSAALLVSQDRSSRWRTVAAGSPSDPGPTTATATSFGDTSTTTKERPDKSARTPRSASAKARDRTVNVAAIIRAALESRVRRAGPHVVG